jgi:hypothetical protein
VPPSSGPEKFNKSICTEEIRGCLCYTGKRSRISLISVCAGLNTEEKDKHI